MFIIPIAFVIAGALCFFYIYTRFLLERRTNLAWTVIPAFLFLLGVYLRKPVIYFVEHNVDCSIRNGSLFKDYPIWASLTLLLMAPIIEELLKGIWIFPFRQLRKRLFLSVVSILELGAITGVGFGTMEAIWLGFQVKNALSTFSFTNWIGFIVERLAAILGHSMLTTVLLFSVYLCFVNKNNTAKGWSIGYLKAIALHTFLNSSLIWYYLRDLHWVMMPIFIVHYSLAFFVLFLLWSHIYDFAEEIEKGRIFS